MKRAPNGALLPFISAASAAVIRLEIVGDRFGVGLVDRRAISLDHFRDLGIPARRLEKRRVHRDVGEGVTGLTIGLDLVESVARLELDRLLGARGGGTGHQRGDGKRNSEYSHGRLP